MRYGAWARGGGGCGGCGGGAEMRERRIVKQLEPEENPNQRAAAEHRDDLKKFAGGVVSASGMDEALANFSKDSIGKSEEFNVAGAYPLLSTPAIGRLTAVFGFGFGGAVLRWCVAV